MARDRCNQLDFGSRIVFAGFLGKEADSLRNVRAFPGQFLFERFFRLQESLANPLGSRRCDSKVYLLRSLPRLLRSQRTTGGDRCASRWGLERSGSWYLKDSTPALRRRTHHPPSASQYNFFLPLRAGER